MNKYIEIVIPFLYNNDMNDGQLLANFVFFYICVTMFLCLYVSGIIRGFTALLFGVTSTIILYSIFWDLIGKYGFRF